MPTSFPKYKLPGATATIAPPPNRFKKLTFNAAPAVMEFGVFIGAGTEPVVLTGGMDGAAIKAALEACADLEGYAVEVVGGTQVSGTGPDGVELHSGSFVVVVQGEEPLPVWNAVQNSEVQTLVIQAGGGNYTLNAGSGFNAGIGQDDLQNNQRALAGAYSDVIVKGIGTTGTYPDVTVSGAITYAVINGQYQHQGQVDGAPRFINENGSYIRWQPNATRWNIQREDSFLVYINTNGSINTGWAGSWIDVNEDGGSLSVSAFGTDSGATAHFHSYFPYSAGNITNPTATGTNATADTLTQGGSESDMVVASDCDLETLLRAALENPATAPVSAGFTPTGNEHWQSPPPTTLDEAIHRTAYAMNELFWEQVP